MSSAYSCRRSGPIINDPSFVNISENPMMALSGVRSSWLMVARKRLLATLARSASARASSSTCSWTLRSVMSRMTATTSRSLPLEACSSGRQRISIQMNCPGEATAGSDGSRRTLNSTDRLSSCAAASASAVRYAGRSATCTRSNRPWPRRSCTLAPKSGSAAGDTNRTVPLRPWRVMTSVMLRASRR